MGGLFACSPVCTEEGYMPWYTLPMRMSTERIPAVLFFLIWGITLFHLAAEQYYWYWQYRWLDIPMHFLGGVWLGLAGIWVIYHIEWFKNIRDRTTPLLAALLAGLVIGILWEGYEFVVWQLAGNGLPIGYWEDTAKDIVIDIIGAYCGYLLYRCCFTASRT